MRKYTIEGQEVSKAEFMKGLKAGKSGADVYVEDSYIPTPWKRNGSVVFDANNAMVLEVENENHVLGDYIVRAINCHETAMGLIEELVTTLLSYKPFDHLTADEKHMLFEANQLTRPVEGK